jgi:hypothetical protein
MKVIVETVDGEQYCEIVLRGIDMDILDQYRMLSKEIRLKGQKINLSIRKELSDDSDET